MLTHYRVDSAKSAHRRRQVDDFVIYAFAVLTALFLGAASLASGHVPFPAAAAVYAVGAVLIFARPVAGVYMLTFFSLVGDPQTMSWYPFNKNGSSAESILYVADQLVASPFDGFVVITVLSLVWRMVRRRQATAIPAEFLWPLGILFVAVGFGIVWGYLNGGELSIAINASRNLLLLPVLYLLVAVLVRERRHIRMLLGLAVAAMTIEAIFTLFEIYYGMSPASRSDLFASGQSATTHSASAQANTVLLMLVSVWLVRRASLGARLIMPFAAIPVVWAYILAERRSAVGSLLIALGLVAVVLFGTDSKRFWRIVPLTGMVFALYVGAFWGSDSALAFPARAVESQISPDNASASDTSSDVYRVIENINLHQTIKDDPILGTGFGRRYRVIIDQPDISGNFPLWNYIPHNSILFVWLKAGVVGITSLLVLAFVAVRRSVQVAIWATRPNDVVAAAVAGGSIVSFLVFTYFDISWENQGVMLLAASLGIITALGRIATDEAAEAGDGELSVGAVA